MIDWVNEGVNKGRRERGSDGVSESTFI